MFLGEDIGGATPCSMLVPYPKPSQHKDMAFRDLPPWISIRCGTPGAGRKESAFSPLPVSDASVFVNYQTRTSEAPVACLSTLDLL